MVLESIDEIQFLQDTPWIRRDVESMRQVLADTRLQSLLTVCNICEIRNRNSIPWRPHYRHHLFAGCCSRAFFLFCSIFTSFALPLMVQAGVSILFPAAAFRGTRRVHTYAHLNSHRPHLFRVLVGLATRWSLRHTASPFRLPALLSGLRPVGLTSRPMKLSLFLPLPFCFVFPHFPLRQPTTYAIRFPSSLFQVIMFPFLCIFSPWPCSRSCVCANDSHQTPGQQLERHRD